MRRRAITLAVLIAAAASVAPVAAQADRQAEELADVEQRLKDRAEEERRLKNEVEEREKEVESLRRRMVETAYSLQDSEKRMGEIIDDLKRIDGETDELETRLKSEQEVLGDVLAGLQSMELSKPPALLVSPEDANKAARAAILLSDAAPTMEARARAIRTDIERLQGLRAEREQQRLALEKTSEEISARRTVLAELLKKKLAERDVAASLAAAAQKETAALAARATSLRELIDRLKRLASSITPRLKPAPPKPNQAAPAPSPKPRLPAEPFKPGAPFTAARGVLRPPVVGRLIASFGDARPGGGRLEGVRFAARDKALVTSPYEASVAFARPYEPVGGNLIVLDVGRSYHILLIGVSSILVQEGQKVAAGEPVGAMSGGPDGELATLDLEIRKGGEPVNPKLWLSRKSVEEMAF